MIKNPFPWYVSMKCIYTQLCSLWITYRCKRFPLKPMSQTFPRRLCIFIWGFDVFLAFLPFYKLCFSFPSPCIQGDSFNFPDLLDEFNGLQLLADEEFIFVFMLSAHETFGLPQNAWLNFLLFFLKIKLSQSNVIS